MPGSVRVEKRGSVGTIVLENVGKLNALDKAMWVGLGDAFEELASDNSLRCVTIAGAGGQAFASGADIAEFASLRSNLEQARAYATHVHRAMHAVRDARVPTIALIRGVCTGGGLELAACCDLRICTADSRFGIPVNKLGATLIHAELEALLQLASPQVALEILLEGRILSAQEALAKGLVTRVVDDPATFDAECARMVARVVEGAPLAARLHKRFIRRMQAGAAWTPAEVEETYACFATEDYRRGFSSFVAKSKPKFEGN